MTNPQLKIVPADALKAAVKSHLLWTVSPAKGKRADLSYSALSGIDLSGLELRGIVLVGADLARARFDRCGLVEADFFGSNLTEASLRGAKLGRAILRGARLSGADLEGADLRDADLREGVLYRYRGPKRVGGVELSGAAEGPMTNFFRADLSNARLSGSVFRGARMAGAIMANATMVDADFSGCDLTGSDLRGADLSGANFTDAKMSGVKLLGVALKQTLFSGADLTGLMPEDFNQVKDWAPDAKFDPPPVNDRRNFGAVLAQHEKWLESDGREGKQAVFERADLSGMDLSERLLRLVVFRRCSLAGALFAGTQLFAVDFSGSDLRQALFRGAVVNGGRFDDADLSTADFRECRIAPLPLAGEGGGQIVTSFNGAKLTRNTLAGAIVVAGDFANTALDERGPREDAAGSSTPRPAQP
jgi:uncharacterized protein YjbI with pentapeptide repeats